jgi:uncharacterized membrane protein (DUF485 family)
MLKQTKKMLICSTILFFFAPTNAHAGIVSLFLIFEAILPPAILWVLFVLIWYLSISIVATRHGAAVGGVPPLPKAIWVLTWIGTLSLLMIGPMGVIYLLLFFPLVTLQAFRDPKKTRISAQLATALRRISIVGIVLLIGLTVSAIYIHNQRSKADFQRLLAFSQTTRQTINAQVITRLN